LPEKIQRIRGGYGYSDSPEIPESLDQEFRQKYHELLKQPYFIYVGRTNEIKGCFELIHAFSMMRDQYQLNDVNLAFVGSTEIPLNDWKGIHFLGILPEAEKTFLIRHARALVNPSPHESMSIVLHEAWRQKTPVVVNGNCEVTRNICERSGGGVFYYSKAGFQSLLKFLYSQADDAKKLGQNGYDFIRRGNNWDRIIGSIYKGISHG
jgi:glycosyltransferase involved in cell wall biosynthesis